MGEQLGRFMAYTFGICLGVGFPSIILQKFLRIPLHIQIIPKFRLIIALIKNSLAHPHVLQGNFELIRAQVQPYFQQNTFREASLHEFVHFDAFLVEFLLFAQARHHLDFWWQQF